ncbi:UDP-glucose 6-dehydrogenase, partial [Campylobacter jejuni]|nr:UDP-glucose 6-dehydrogenase [Campylobacter jejuni]
AYDPISNGIFAKTYDYKIHYEANLNDIINKCNVLIIATAWQEFRHLINKQNKIIYNLRWMGY